MAKNIKDKEIDDFVAIHNFVNRAFELLEQRTVDKDILVKMNRTAYNKGYIYASNPKWYRADPKIDYTVERLHQIQEIVKTRGYYSWVVKPYDFIDDLRYLKIMHINDYLRDVIYGVRDKNHIKCRPIVDNFTPEELKDAYNEVRTRYFNGTRIALNVEYTDALITFEFEKFISDTCIICRTEKSTKGYKGCQHICMCQKCYKTHTDTDDIPRCPVCRLPIHYNPPTANCFNCAKRFYRGEYYSYIGQPICRQCRLYEP